MARTEIQMLNPKARDAINYALDMAAETYERLANDETLPQMIRAEYSAKLHMAKTLSEAFGDTALECTMALKNTREYRALIWADDRGQLVDEAA